MINLLQADLNRIHQWSQLWQLQLSLPKCEVVHVGHGNPFFDYEIEGTALGSKLAVRDLGLLISNDLKFHKHIDQI